MLPIIGWVIVLACVFTGYVAAGGHMGVLWQPFEFLIILGAAAGAFITGNTKSVLKATGKGMGVLLKGPRHTKESYLELLSLQYQIFKIAKTKGLLALESHIERPEESSIFQSFPKFFADHHAMEFMCDYLRLMSLGTENPHELADLMDEEIETHHNEHLAVANAVQGMADGMPALGIVAAVLGVIHTMGSITEPPAVLGKLIGGALVGTFFGVLAAYGFVAPVATALKAIYDTESKYYQCMKAGLLAHVSGYAPAISVEFARKTLTSDVKPTFFEVEEATAALPPA
ncbi:MAG TPA: flagellar motor stator protein MotA [Alphaproteobacteria bacterium]|nr:flagellar motor stator protein MotA [Alphaproteobacteria bacterium]